ncbi:hypothetical protein Cpir12675_006720 [Ceratocystis pirilliformis]|uniref:Inner membrane assembly complex subunit 17 n=1 Tax=Ceratocystis pirilliformis TaxID=259994 RepID=A0ABR3YGT1_9PEZI
MKFSHSPRVFRPLNLHVPWPAARQILPPRPIRRYSTERPAPSHTDFYKTFGRPIAKVLLIAMFTYQLLYLGWTKLEHNDVKKIRGDEVAKLEEQVKELRGQKKL